MLRTSNVLTRLCCVGNSLTEGSGQVPYPTQIQARLPTSWVVTNRSRGGWPTAQAPGSPDAFTNLQYIYPTDALPDISGRAVRNILVMWEVRNQMGLGSTPRQAVDSLWIYVARARRSGWEVWVCTVIDTNPIGFTNGDRLTANGYIAAEAAANGCQVIDLAADARLATRTNLTYFSGDEIHLTTVGYGVVAELVAAAVYGLAAPLPSRDSFLRCWWTPDQNVVETTGEVSTWTGRTPGTAVVATGAMGQRPIRVAGEWPRKAMRFLGTDRLTIPSASFGALGTKTTIAGWVKIHTGVNANDTLLSTNNSGVPSMSLGTTTGGGPTNAERWIGSVSDGVNALGMNGAADGQVPKGVWQFISFTWDAAGATSNDKLRFRYKEHGQDQMTLQPQVAFAGPAPATLPVGAGTGTIGDLDGFNRQLPFDTTGLFVWVGQALTDAELIATADLYDPLDGVLSVLALGDSITAGSGDLANRAGWREDLKRLAGSDEAFWYVGRVRSGALMENNRNESVGGSKTDAHLTYYNAAIAAGWDPDIIIGCSGRNDLNAGELALLPARYAALFAAFAGTPAIWHTIPDTVPTDPNTATANGYLIAAAAAHPNVAIVTSAAVGDFDGVHPGPANHLLMALAFWEKLRDRVNWYRSGPALLPQAASLLWSMDPAFGIISAVGLVSSWTSRYGSSVFSAAAGLQPVLGNGHLDFDGVNDSLTAAYSTAIHPAGATKVTVATWLRFDVMAAAIAVLGTSGVYGEGIWLIFDAGYYDWVVGGPAGDVTRVTTKHPAGVWQFVAMTWDGARAAPNKVRTYYGTTTVAQITPGLDENVLTSIPASSGAAFIGGNATFNGQQGPVLLWSGVELTLAELQQVAAMTRPIDDQPAPPQQAFLITWMDTSHGVADSGGLVTAWTSRVGTATYSAAGGARPTKAAKYFTYNGTANTLTRACDAQSHPSGTKCTVMFWYRMSSVALAVAHCTGPNTVGVYYQINAGNEQSLVSNNLVTLVFTPTVSTWYCICEEFDSGTGNLYRSTDPEVSFPVVGTAAGGAIAAPSGNSCIGSLDVFGRYFPGDISGMLIYSGVTLTADEKREAARIIRPF